MLSPYFLGGLILVTSGFGIATLFVRGHYSTIYVFMGYQMVAGIIRFTSASIVQLYPTELKTMAMNLALVFSRIGAVSGAYISGLYLKSHCEWYFGGVSVALIFVGLLTFLLPKVRK